MYVIGATHPELFGHIRTLAPDNFFLVPGIGAQGGDLKMVAQYGMNNQCGLLVNVSRSIIYASEEKDFAKESRKRANEILAEMSTCLTQL
jgi:orotidine-5'-phosphate decarboxylase